MRRTLMLSAAALVLCAANLSAQSEDKDAVAADEKRLKEAYQGTDGKSLVEFLKTRGKGEVEPKVLDQLLKDLASKDATERDKACQQLVAIGAPAIPKLRLLARGRDDAAVLVKKLLKILEDDPGNVTRAAVHLLSLRRPPGTAEAFLAYLPHSENDAVMEELKAALVGVAYVKGKAEPALLKALEDPHPLIRANAIVALCAGGNAEPRATLRKLLLDKSPSVRLHAALALAQASDGKAVSTLIALLGDLPGAQAREVEAFLTELAEDQAPKVVLGNDEVSRHKARDAWAKWWLESEGPSLLEELKKRTPLSPVVPRLIALRKPKGAAEAILAYLPFAADESLREELQKALNAVTFTTGKANPVVVKALTDKVPARRAAAAAALCAGPLADHLDAIRKRLDPKSEKDNLVRLRVALALAAAREQEAVPTLIRLIEEMPADQSGPAEEFLLRLARDNPPKDLPDSNDDKSRKKRAAAWQKWWDDNKKAVVMLGPSSDFRPRYLGHVLLIQANNNQIVELGKDNKPRMTITGLKFPWDAQFVGNNKILITEYNGMRVTERDLKGNILWEMKLDFYPMQAERLRNGDTFIVGQNKIVQVNKAKRTVLTITRSNHDVRTARRLPNGQIILITTRNQYVRMDSNGKELKTVALPRVERDQNEILDNGNVLVPLASRDRVVEYNPEGKEVWKAEKIDQPLHVFRLPNQNFLVASKSQPYKFTEYDRTGKKVREHVTNTDVFRVKAR